MTFGCSAADVRFLRADLSRVKSLLKPNLKPLEMPEIKNLPRELFGCPDRYLFHCVVTKGVVMFAASVGTLILTGVPSR